MRLVSVAAAVSPADRASPDSGSRRQKAKGKKQKAKGKNVGDVQVYFCLLPSACQLVSLARTSSFTVLPSTFWPDSFAMTAFMTRPMSFGDDAPVSAIASATARSTAAGSAAARQVRFEHGDFRRFLVGEILTAAARELLDRIPALLDERGDDLLRLGSSSARPFSTSRFTSAALSMRNALSAAACLRIASVIAAWTARRSEPQAALGLTSGLSGWTIARLPGLRVGAGTITPGTERADGAAPGTARRGAADRSGADGRSAWRRARPARGNCGGVADAAPC